MRTHGVTWYVELKDPLSPTFAGELAGKASFASQGVFRNNGRAHLRLVYQRQRSTGSSITLGEPLRKALIALREVIRHGRPRRIHSALGRGSHVVYTDADGRGGVGGVLFRQGHARPLFFRWRVPQSWHARMKPRKTQIEVYEAIATVVALYTFAPYVEGSDLWLFVDNTGAQAAITKGVGGEDDVNAIASAFWTQAAAEDLGIWVERVDSESNPADVPSRDTPDTPFGVTSCDFLTELGAQQLQAVPPAMPFFYA